MALNLGHLLRKMRMESILPLSFKGRYLNSLVWRKAGQHCTYWSSWSTHEQFVVWSLHCPCASTGLQSGKGRASRGLCLTPWLGEQWVLDLDCSFSSVSTSPSLLSRLKPGGRGGRDRWLGMTFHFSEHRLSLCSVPLYPVTQERSLSFASSARLAGPRLAHE